MKLEAWRAATVDHLWAPLVIEQNGHRLELEVSADAAKVDGVRESITAHDQQLLADDLGALLLTARLYEERWRQAATWVLPSPSDVTKTTAAQHSARVDGLLTTFQVQSGGIIADPGKTWIVDQKCDLTHAVNHGWLAPTSWRGAPLRAPAWIKDKAVGIIQCRGAAHGLTHADYSQVALFVRRAAVLDGSPIDLASVYEGKFLCALVTHDAKPVPARQPGVPKAAPQVDDLTPDTQPGGPVVPPVSKAGDGPARVLAWQGWLVLHGYEVKVDGQHGPKTSAATARALAEHPEWMFAKEPAVVSRAVYPFVKAKNFTPAARKAGDVLWIVLHSTENPIKPGVARNVALWFGGAKAPQASAHYVVGPDETIACVREHDVAWAAPGANREGIQIEMVGQALKTTWLADGREVMERTAALVAELCRRWEIPIVRVDAFGLKARTPGITTHAAVTAAFRKSTHVDPGGVGDGRWPWSEFLQLVARG